ncbi:MAG: Gfo/Idh/MocA family oxidoreductase [Chloroflexota bacterium]
MSDSTIRPLRWALIGCGSIGSRHAQWAISTPDVEVRAFCDVNADAASRFCEEYQGGYHTTDPARVFSDPDVDIVTIATTNATHADLALAALNAKKHLYLEKPMAMTTADCHRIVDAMEAAGTKLMLNFSIRFSGAARVIKDRLQPPKVSHVQCMMKPDDITRWRWDPHIGGGMLYDVGIHMVDLLCWMHNSSPVEVFATGGQVTHPGELAQHVIDTAAATIRFANDSVATLLMSDAGSNTLLSKWFFQFFDGSQTAVLHEHFSKVTFTGPDSATGELNSETLTPPPIDRLPLLVDAIRNDTEPYVPAQTGILSTLIIEKIIASIHSGQPQEVRESEWKMDG